MSKEELTSNQIKLKAAIQNHQIYVVKLKGDPGNEELQRDLSSVQREIQMLSEKQKRLVTELRKQLNSGPAIQKSRKPDENKDGAKTPKHKHAHAYIGNGEHIRKPQTSHSQENVYKAHTPHSHKHGAHHAQKQHTPRPSIMQGSRSVLRIQNEVPVTVKTPPAENTDIRHLLQSSMHDHMLTPKQLQKVEYMASLNLVTRERLKELQSRRGKRRQRSTAVPQFSYVHGHLYPERKRNVYEDVTSDDRKKSKIANEVGNATPASMTTFMAVDKEDSSMSEAADKEAAVCVVCERGGDAVTCSSCGSVYHLACIDLIPGHESSHSLICPTCKVSNELRTNSTNPEDSQQQTFRALVAAREREKERERNELEEKSKQLRECGKQLQEQALKLGNIVQRKVTERKSLQEEKARAEERVKRLQEIIEQFKDS